MPLLVTAKSEKPGCFKHVETLPCTYRHNTRAWITYAVLLQFLKYLERRMAPKSLKVPVIGPVCAAPFL